MTKKGLYSFGAGHDVYKKVFNPENPMQQNTEELPGPGAYHYRNKSIGTEGRNFKMQSKPYNVIGKYKFK